MNAEYENPQHGDGKRRRVHATSATTGTTTTTTTTATTSTSTETAASLASIGSLDDGMRRLHATTARTVSSVPPRGSFLHTMALLRQNAYIQLNDDCAAIMEQVADHGTNVTINPSNASSFEENVHMETRILRNTCAEYYRVSQCIDLKYDSTDTFNGKVIGMGSNDNRTIFPSNDDDAEKVKDGTVPPTYVPIASRIRAVSAGGTHSMALTTTGIPYTWGSADRGALGTGDTEGSGEPTPVTGFGTTTHADPSQNRCEDGFIHQIAAGDAHSLFLSIHGNVYQCGSYIDTDSEVFSDSPKYAIPGTKKEGVYGMNKRPMHVHQLPKRAIAISAGKGYNAAILEDNSLVTWGEFFFVLFYYSE